MSTYGHLLIFAESLDDLEKLRIATDNRVRALADSLEGTPEYKSISNLAEQIQVMEHQAVLNLQRAMRDHALGDWVKRTIGVGEKQMARLLSAIGDPAERQKVSQLWAYCGFHVIDGEAPRRRAGSQLNFSMTARMRTRLIAESCVKQAKSPYRAVYDAGREKYEDATHQTPCAQCGSKGKPAEVGSELRDGHKHARALRLVAKEILKDIWVESKKFKTNHE